ncbi:hypothetical protein [uncultured Mediterranean phage]|nr:hypothetical protein [uncultured Mediterranean phage]
MGTVLKFPKRPFRKPPGGFRRKISLQFAHEFENGLAARTAIMALQLHNNIMLFFNHIDQLEEDGKISGNDAAYIESVAHFGLEPEETEPGA